jgi:NADH-quinone oxidoreductase subunit F
MAEFISVAWKICFVLEIRMAIKSKTKASIENNLPAEIDQIIARTGTGAEAVVPVLHAIQEKYHYLPVSALERICEITDITPAAISGVATFYTQFRHTPVGEHIIRVCCGTACHVKGADLVHDAFHRELHIPENGDTAPNGQFTLQRVACLGCCTLAPVVQIDSKTYGHVTPTGIPYILQDFLLSLQRKDEKHITPVPSEQKGEIRIGLGSCCVASGSGDVRKALEDTLAETGITITVKRVGCVGMCHRVPLLEVASPDKETVLYDKVQAADVKNIILRHFKAKSLAQRISNVTSRLLESMLDEDNSVNYSRHALHTRDPQVTVFLERQQHISTEYAGQIDPLDLEEYRLKGGFKALGKALSTSSADEIITQIKDSGLRGRGGAGFPTGEKWELAKRAKGDKKYIICNGDEGDPGAFMDRMILESYPYRVIEGMVIAAYAIGADQGYFYIRAEYPLALQRVGEAIARCEQMGLLGENILGSGFSLQLKIMAGAGAFVCGEETALIASIEGKRGMPHYRPPYPVEKGLWGHTTLVNNCETYATVPWIMRNGSQAFAALGTKKSKGTKVFSLAGKVARGGLIEVPMGITIREIVEEIGGGTESGKRFKAVQIGGPSGGCVPAELAHTRVDYEDLLNVGAMMGSGGLLVMDESDCMVDIARYFLSFTCGQSCGKCTCCRIGTRQMLNILDKLCAGQATEGDLDKLERLANITKRGSLCGLGKTAPNPVLSTLTYFREEYQAHLKGVCPAKRCKELIKYSITDDCIGCTICAQKCPVDAIPITPYEKHEIIQEKCTKCNTCYEVCPHQAVEII